MNGARSDEARLAASLERAAEVAGDLCDTVHREFLARCPEAATLIDFVDRNVLGRMLAEVLDLLATPPDAWPLDYLAFEGRNHHGYGVRGPVARDMAGAYLAALESTVRRACGPDWDPATAGAWRRRTTVLADRFSDAVARAGRPGGRADADP